MAAKCPQLLAFLREVSYGKPEGSLCSTVAPAECHLVSRTCMVVQPLGGSQIVLSVGSIQLKSDPVSDPFFELSFPVPSDAGL